MNGDEFLLAFINTRTPQLKASLLIYLSRFARYQRNGRVYIESGVSWRVLHTRSYHMGRILLHVTAVCERCRTLVSRR